MQLIDYTHPTRVPRLYIPLDRRDARYYLRLDELPRVHPYFSPQWALFRFPDWLEGGSAWVQAAAINEDLCRQVVEGDVCLVIGSDDPEFDEAMAQALVAMGWRVKVAEVISMGVPK